MATHCTGGSDYYPFRENTHPPCWDFFIHPQHHPKTLVFSATSLSFAHSSPTVATPYPLSNNNSILTNVDRSLSIVRLFSSTFPIVLLRIFKEMKLSTLTFPSASPSILLLYHFQIRSRTSCAVATVISLINLNIIKV